MCVGFDFERGRVAGLGALSLVPVSGDSSCWSGDLSSASDSEEEDEEEV